MLNLYAKLAEQSTAQLQDYKKTREVHVEQPG